MIMKGLYKRNYLELTPSEIEEKKRIDAEESHLRAAKFGRKNHLFLYPKAVRHYYASLFPNNYIDFMDLRNEKELVEQCDNFEKLLDNKETKELDIKHYIQDNEYYHIPASILYYYNFGHHEAVLFKEFPLGTRYQTDYLLAGRRSGGWEFVFVEFEAPYGSITLADGEWGNVVRKGLKQISDWKKFIESNYAIIHDEFTAYTERTLPEEFIRYDSTRMHYVVVAGRRDDFEHDSVRREQRYMERENEVRIIHYDNLLDSARELIGAKSY